jgi:hypothetical protein
MLGGIAFLVGALARAFGAFFRQSTVLFDALSAKALSRSFLATGHVILYKITPEILFRCNLPEIIS